MKIAVICWWDRFSGKNIARALATKHDVSYVDREETSWRDYDEAISRADAILVKGDLHATRVNGKLFVFHPLGQELPDMSNHVLRPGAKLICAPAGQNFRRLIEGYHKAEENRPLSDYTDHYDFIAPITPDLNYPEINGMFLPMAVNTKETSNTWRKRNPLSIAAYMSSWDAKGVEQYLIPAITTLRGHGHAIKMTIGQGEDYPPIPHKDFVEIKKNSTLCFAQMAPMGIYANHGLEAMSYGVPIIMSHNAQTIKQAYPVENYGEPCLKANTIDELKALLRSILRGRIDLGRVSRETYAYVERVHSYDNIARIFEMIMERIA